MKKYEKPTVFANEDLSEGIYAASGGTAQGMRIIPCDAFEFRPNVYRYDIWFDNLTNVADSGIDVVVNFDVPVTFDYGDDVKSHSGDGTNSLTLHFAKVDAEDPSRDRGLQVGTTVRPTLRSFSYK